MKLILKSGIRIKIGKEDADNVSDFLMKTDKVGGYIRLKTNDETTLVIDMASIDAVVYA